MWLRDFFSKPDKHKSAAFEVIVVTIFSLVPLFVLPPLADLRYHPSQISFSIIWKAVDSGQLFLYSFGVFGMLIWLLGISRKKTPDGVFYISLLLVIVPSIVCILMISNDPDFKVAIDPFLVKISIVLYVLYVLLSYFLIVCRDTEVNLKQAL